MITFLTPDKPQIFFHVKDMTNEQSANVVIDALKKLDGGATVRVDLPMRTLEIGPTSAEPAAFRDAISNAGFSTVRQWPSDFAYLWA
jgi:copper chaperone CopZ